MINLQDLVISKKMATSEAQLAKTGNPHEDGWTNWLIYNLRGGVIEGMLKTRQDYQRLYLK